MGSLPLGDFKVMWGFPDDMVFGGYGPAEPPLSLNEERGDLVSAHDRLGKKGMVSEARTAMALKSHSEAERRRRERINAHLSTLRSLVPGTDKLDKAALLGEVISHVRELKHSAMEISKGYDVPTDVDEVKVEVCGNGSNGSYFLIKVSLCCEDRPELLIDLKQTLQALRLKTVKAEISTLGGRVKNVLVMSCEGTGDDHKRKLFTNAIHHALKSLLDRVSSTSDFSPTSSLSGKRRRTSLF
uniref:Transcription factor bHLH30 n=1 Tax=Anthurium amnicola TaxID=1678845 RepID=A0A1D1YEV4_9ARAE